jgi:hypothetical protein
MLLLLCRELGRCRSAAAAAVLDEELLPTLLARGGGVAEETSALSIERMVVLPRGIDGARVSRRWMVGTREDVRLGG